MAEERETKRPLVSLSSSSDEQDYVSDEGDDEYQGDSDESDDDRDYDDEEEEEDQDEEEFEDSDDQPQQKKDRNNGGLDESSFDKIFRLLREDRELGSLTLNECKAYLRKYGLRVTGTKSECVQRIRDHWRLRDGNGEALYPRSSFSINCTGDVCKGDVVLFWQEVYEKFDKMTRHGRVLGTRVVAGRIVKESYGAAKQQHTFTVEVLWSRGIKKLPPLFALLVKGRNLYRMRTFRQRWSDEAERKNVLAEKHRRGDEARHKRATKTNKWPNSDRCIGNFCTKRKGEFPSTRESKMRTKVSKKGKDYYDRSEKCTPRESRASKNHRNRSSTFRTCEHYKENKKLTCPSSSKVSTFTDSSRIHHQSQMRSHHKNFHDPFPRQDRNADLAWRNFPPSNASADTYVMPARQYPQFGHSNYSNHAYVNPGYNNALRTRNGFSELEFRQPFHSSNPGTNTYWQRR